jgi:hypothetical protein
LTGLFEVTHYETIYSFVNFKFVLALPVASLLQKGVAFVNILLYFYVVFLDEVNCDEFESDVHFFTNLDGVFKGKVEGLDCFDILLMVVVELSLGQESVPDLSLSEVVLCVFNLQI